MKITESQAKKFEETIEKLSLKYKNGNEYDSWAQLCHVV